MTMSNDIVTISGNIGNDPTKNQTRAGKAVINFRVGSSHRYVDQRTGEWTDGGTNWYAVSAFGKLAENAKASLHRGDAVVVTGRLKVKEWEANGKKGIDVEITADAIGHDLNFGTSGFARRQRPAAAEAGVPANVPSGEMTAGVPFDDGEPTDEQQDAWRAVGMTLPGDSVDNDVDAEQPEPTYA